MTKAQKLINKHSRSLLGKSGLDVATDVKDGVVESIIIAMSGTMDLLIDFRAP